MWQKLWAFAIYLSRLWLVSNLKYAILKDSNDYCLFMKLTFNFSTNDGEFQRMKTPNICNVLKILMCEPYYEIYIT